MVALSTLVSAVSGLVSSSWGWLKWALLAAAAAVLIGLFALLWHDYQTAKHDATYYRTVYLDTRAELDQAAALARRNTEVWNKERARYREDLRLSARVSADRLARMNQLAGRIARLKHITRPDHESNCPVHPAIVAAFDLLRREAAGDPAGARPARAGPDADPATGAAAVPGRPAPAAGTGVR